MNWSPSSSTSCMRFRRWVRIATSLNLALLMLLATWTATKIRSGITSTPIFGALGTAPVLLAPELQPPPSRRFRQSTSNLFIYPRNLLAVRKNPTTTTLPGSYLGYASCPLFVGRLKLMLAEFKYDGVIDETFYKDQEKPRYIFYFMKRFFFPLAYWWLVPRGMWLGRKGIRWS